MSPSILHFILVGFQNHGRDFEAVASLIESKSATQVKNFFFNYKRKYNLLKHVSDYEIRNVRKLMILHALWVVTYVLYVMYAKECV